jgi:uncharacterized membrane protein (UPF0127 family)
MRGLLGRNSLPSGEGILLQPAPSIHTAFMRFSIDAIFLDSTLKVKKVVEDLAPWRMASAHNASTVLEMAAGEIAQREISVGDQLGLVKVSDRVGAVVTALAKSSASRTDPAATDESVLGLAHRAPDGLGDEARTKILIVATDRRFRSVASALLARRGCTVVLGDRLSDAAELADRDQADVVVLDAGSSPALAVQCAARVAALDRPVGAVIAGDVPSRAFPTPILEKWGEFDRLYEAIELARPDHRRVANGYGR